MLAGHQKDGFWEFSVRTYRSPGVSDACLSLQNDYGADVNMLLFCCWLGTFGGELDRQLLARAAKFSTKWAQAVVLPIRSTRTWMKQTGCTAEGVPAEACMALREKIKSVELETERLQQEVLESLVSKEQLSKAVPAEFPEASMVALKQYAAYADIQVCDDVQRKLLVIIDAALADQERRSSA